MISRRGALTTWSRRVDWPTMLAMLVLVVIGVISVMSAVSSMGNASRYIVKQLAAVGIGFFALFIVTSLNYQLYRTYPAVIYGLSVAILLSVLFLGTRIKGAQSWIVLGPISIQPIEFARIGYIISLAALLDRPERETVSVRILLAALALGGFHILIILLEPNLGGTLAYGPVTLGMLYFAGVSPLYVVSMIFYVAMAAGIPILSTLFSVQPQLVAGHPILAFIANSAKGVRPMIEFLFVIDSLLFGLWWFVRKLYIRIPWQVPVFLGLIVLVGVGTASMTEHVIKDYQRKRIIVFVSPGFDPLGAGYNILQSQIAVGSGRFFGKGLFSGTQTQLGFLPEQHTDFIFSVIGEEMGFFWAAGLLGAFGILVWRAFTIAMETQDRFGTLIAVGIGCLIAFECVMNVGMVLGILPVTGVPLPFVSYGGSQMVSSFIAIGLLQSVNFRRYIYA